MTLTTLSFLRRIGTSMITGALLLSPPSMAPGSHKVSLGQADHLVQRADVISPNTFHHWPDTGLADLDPSTFHHWPHQAASVTEIDPNTFHHWPKVTVSVAEIDPDTFHHWP